MSYRTKRVIFITPFYTLFEFFLLKYLFLLIGSVTDSYIVVLAIILGLIHLLPMFFEARKSTPLGRLLATIDGIWMWASVMFFIEIAAIYFIGNFIRLPGEIICLLLLIVPVLGVYNYYRAHKLVIHEKTLKLDNLSRNINIVHLSDVHFGSIRHRDIIHQICEKLNELEKTCDLAIISGDLADGSCVVEEDDLMEFAEVGMPVIFTPGNHDYYPGIDDVVRACKKAGIIVLDNKIAEFECLNIVGLSYSVKDRSMPEFDRSQIKEGSVNIVNYHVPYYWDEFSSLGFDVQLSGHTHGGQFYPAVWVGNLLFKYNKGLFKDKSGHYIHVTTGVGSMDVPMRWGTDSELVILKLQKTDKFGN